MKTKKYVLALAIFGGMLFTVQAADIIQFDDQVVTKIEKKQKKKPSVG